MTGRNTRKLSTALLPLLFASSSWAGLGGIQVKSSLGEPLRAQIALTGLDATTPDNLRVALAGPDAFRDLNVDYAPALSSLRFAIVRSGAKAYIRVSSTYPINEPFLRFVVDARSPAGRSVREYTLLLDPADYPLRQPVLEQSPPPRERVSAGATSPAPRAAGRAQEIYVQPGQTLMSIAREVRPQGASLQQTMSALLQANPQAFAGGDPERLLAGSRLSVPSARRIQRAAADTPPPPPSVGRKAQPGAALAPLAPPPAPKPVAADPVAPAAPAAAGSEVVKLTAPDGASDAAARMSELEADIARRDQALKETQAQIARLEQQLKALQQAPQPPAPAPSQEESGWLDGVLAQLPLIGGGLAAGLLALLGVNIVLRRRRDAAKVGAALGGRPLAGASMLARGPQAMGEPHTQASHTFLTDFTRSSMGSIDAGEVDPVAEAEVYLAYGRDQQAEDILKDALAKDPTRHEVRVKLLEIYSQRRDKAAFSQQAAELKAATDARGALWERAAAMGVMLDPGNPLYGENSAGNLAALEPEATAAAGEIDLDAELLAPAAEVKAAPPAPAMAFEPAAPVADASANSLDFDLDALLNGAENIDAAPAPQAAPAALAPVDDNLLDFDFSSVAPASVAPQAEPAATGFDALFELDSVAPAPAVETAPDGGIAASAPSSATVAAPAADLDSLFDLDAEFAETALPASDFNDPLSTKLDLARVYLDMGDKEGAREVLAELLAEASGALHEQAQALMDQL